MGKVDALRRETQQSADGLAGWKGASPFATLEKDIERLRQGAEKRSQATTSTSNTRSWRNSCRRVRR